MHLDLSAVTANHAVTLDEERVQLAHQLYLQEGLGARDDAIPMQYLMPGWKFDPKRPSLDREGVTL